MFNDFVFFLSEFPELENNNTLNEEKERLKEKKKKKISIHSSFLYRFSSIFLNSIHLIYTYSNSQIRKLKQEKKIATFYSIYFH